MGSSQLIISPGMPMKWSTWEIQGIWAFQIHMALGLSARHIVPALLSSAIPCTYCQLSAHPSIGAYSGKFLLCPVLLCSADTPKAFLLHTVRLVKLIPPRAPKPTFNI